MADEKLYLISPLLSAWVTQVELIEIIQEWTLFPTQLGYPAITIRKRDKDPDH